MIQFLLGIILGSGTVAVGFMLRQRKLLNQLLNKDQEIAQLRQSLNLSMVQKEEVNAQLSSLKTEYKKLLDSKDQEIKRLNELLAETHSSLVHFSESSSALAKNSSQDLALVQPANIKVMTSLNLENLPPNYQELEQYLRQKMWQKADEQTIKIMLTVTQTQGNSLAITEIRDFPLAELNLLDQLWLYYSNNHFGFSCQRQIYLASQKVFNASPEVWNEVGKQLGWKINHKWVSTYGELTFSTEAPRGQFPFLAYWQGKFLGDFLTSQGDRFIALMTRLADV